MRYVYKFDAPTFFRKELKFNTRFLSLRLTRLYYLTFHDHQFRNVFRSAAKKDGNFETNYLRFLESRMFALIYRLNLSSDVFWLLRFVKRGFNFLIDTFFINCSNHVLSIGQLLTVRRK